MDLPKDTTDSIMKLMNKTESSKELEIRFGKFNTDGFKPGISLLVFEELIKFISMFAKFQCVEYSTILYFEK